MDQPKFKLREKVVTKDSPSPWEIKGFYKYDNTEWLYIRGETYISYAESELVLYEEPKPKKLYAYVCMESIKPRECSEVRLFTGELPEAWKAFKRMPEYDITYQDGV
jgi:hypothetical protein